MPIQTAQFQVTGMTCGGCVTKVTRALKAKTGVGEVKVSLSSGETTVQYDERHTTPAQLTSAVTEAGYGINGARATPKDQSKGGCCG